MCIEFRAKISKRKTMVRRKAITKSDTVEVEDGQELTVLRKKLSTLGSASLILEDKTVIDELAASNEEELEKQVADIVETSTSNNTYLLIFL